MFVCRTNFFNKCNIIKVYIRKNNHEMIKLYKVWRINESYKIYLLDTKYN